MQIIETTPFATAVDVATVLRRPLSAEDAATVETLLPAASAAIRAECEWHIWPRREDDEIVVDGPGGKILTLPTLYLVELVQILDSDDIEVDATAYRASMAGLVKRTDGGYWSADFAAYTVTMTHGYPDRVSPPAGGSAAPADLVVLTSQIVARSLINPTGAMREQAGQVSITHAPGAAQRGTVALLPGELDQLKLYRAR